MLSGNGCCSPKSHQCLSLDSLKAENEKRLVCREFTWEVIPESRSKGQEK